MNIAGSRGRRAVDRGRRAEHELADGARPLARGQQLHRADDVELLGGPDATALRRVDVEVDDGVDVLDRDDLADDGRADVGADELHAAEVASRQDRVDPDDPVDAGILAEVGEPTREPGRERARDAGDKDDPAHVGYLPRRRRCTRVRLSILRCFFFDIRLRRFLMTEPTGHYSILVGHARVAWCAEDLVATRDSIVSDDPRLRI